MNLKKSWDLEIDPNFFKSLKRVPRNQAEHILRAVKELPQNPFIGDIQKMKGEENIWRRRVGAYRIFYEIYSEEKVIRVFEVKRRTSKTY